MTATPVTGKCRICECQLPEGRVYCGPHAIVQAAAARKASDARRAAYLAARAARRNSVLSD